MKLSFEVLGRRHLEWLRCLRNQNREWFLDSRIIEHPEEEELWFRLSCRKGDLNLVIMEEAERIGFISVYNISGVCANIGRMMVDDKFKHKGYMEKAIIKVLYVCKETLGLEELTLEVKKSNIPARELYSKFGFITYGITQETLVMRKKLL